MSSSIKESSVNEITTNDHSSDHHDNEAFSSNNIAATSFTTNTYDNLINEVLENKMAVLELADTSKITTALGDGSDSGVDIANCMTRNFERTLSNNSGGYHSSNELYQNGNISCNSSMISYGSDIGDTQKGSNKVFGINSNYECPSENGSESSSIIAASKIRKQSVVKNKNIPLSVEPNTLRSSSSSKKMPEDNLDTSPSALAANQFNKTTKTRLSSVHRTQSLTRPIMPVLQTRERARSREKASTKPSSSSSNKTAAPIYKSTPLRNRPPKPDSLPSALNSASSSLNRFGQRTPSLTRGSRTPGTPSDDGRWPSVGIRNNGLKQTQRCGSAAPDLVSLKSRVNMMSFDTMKSLPAATNIYATLPRRKKQKSEEDLTINITGNSTRSNSETREQMTSSLVVPGKKTISQSYSFKDATPSKTLPPYPRSRKFPLSPRTKIYHETSVQTNVTGQDFDNIICRSTNEKFTKIDEGNVKATGIQFEARDKEIEILQEKLRKLEISKDDLQSCLENKTKKILNMEIQLNKERVEKLAVQKELHLNTERVIGMLELARCTPTEEQNFDSLLMLESQIQMSGHELNEKQDEIKRLKRVCRVLQNEMERSLSAQECLMKEKSTLERESNELQDFLQNEKTALCDALKEAENELQATRSRLEDKEEEVKVLRDECRHLVRLNEQRRQENKAMQSKYSALEIGTKELSSQKHAAVSGASMALNGLNSRLSNLVEQLISSYNISEQDLEDVVFHNEAYPNSGSSGDGSPECKNNTNNSYRTSNTDGLIEKLTTGENDGSLSPQRNQSFIAAVISAIRSATMSNNKKISRHKNTSDNRNQEESDHTEMLDSETEPCLMMDNVLEDVPMPDCHSHNMVSSQNLMISQIEIPSDIMYGDESLQNLSQAITNRQQIEIQINTMTAQKLNQCKHLDRSISDDISCHDSVAEMPSISEYCPAQALVDQVIEVDNLVTKLLKVLRLIQMDNDNCIQHLITDKNKLQLNKEEMLEKMKDIENINMKLRDDLMDATQELMIQQNDLSNSRAEIQRNRNEIDRLNQDICNLNEKCQTIKSSENIASTNGENFSDEILEYLKMWREQGYLMEPNVITFLIQTCEESSYLQEKLFKSQDSICMYQHIWQDQSTVNEAKKQYDVIDRALDILYSIQPTVQANQALIKLQKDLEEAANFKATTNILPMYTTGYLSNDDSHSNFFSCEDNSNLVSTAEDQNSNDIKL